MIGIPQAVTVGLELLKQVLPDKGQREAATLKLMELQQSGDLKELDAAMQVIIAEAQSDSWITRSWRPIIMLMFGAIIANNYILYPYLALFWAEAPVLELPPDLWDLMKIGLGGYVVGRSAQAVAKSKWEKNDG